MTRLPSACLIAALLGAWVVHPASAVEVDAVSLPVPKSFPKGDYWPGEHDREAVSTYR